MVKSTRSKKSLLPDHFDLTDRRANLDIKFMQISNAAKPLAVKLLLYYRDTKIDENSITPLEMIT